MKLCNKCNTGLGAFNDNVEGLNKAINYLQQDRIISNEGWKL